MKELTLTASLENIPEATAFIDAQLEALDCPMKAQMQIDVAIDELFANIAQYAYAPDVGEARIRFEFDDSSRMASITFIDRGVPYDPLAKPDPDVTLSAEERQIGGLGIYMAKKSMDEVRYECRNGQNVLTLIKILKNRQSSDNLPRGGM